MKQPAGMVIAEDNGVELEREELWVDVGAEMALLDGNADGSG
jgi:hypothetical protein